MTDAVFLNTEFTDDTEKNMRWTAATVLLLLGGSITARAQEPVPLARGNTPGEPHHHLKIENEYVRVYYVEVPPHENTQLHQHDHDYIYVSLGPADVVNAIQNKPEIHLQLTDGETHFTRGGFAHVARNLADTPFRNVTIELLKPQGDAHNFCARVFASMESAGCPRSPGSFGFSMEAQFETAATFLNLVRLDPETTSYGAPPIQGATLVVALNESEVQLNLKGKPARTLRGGEMTWIDAGLQGAAFNPGKKSSSYLELVFTGSKERKPRGH